MLLGRQLRATGACSCLSERRTATRAVRPSARPSRSSVLGVQNVGDFFNKLKKGASGGDAKGGNSEDAAKRALQNTFNDQKKYQNFFGRGSGTPPETGGGTPPSGGGGGWFSGGSGGSSGGGFSGFGSSSEGAGGSSNDQTLLQEFLEVLKYTWVVFWNLALFLGFANILHRSLDWCASVELLLLIGAGQQAFERVAGVFFGWVEWAEKHLLGWDIPSDENMIPQYKNISMFYPEQHAYTFDQYRYNMTDAEKQTLKRMYALRHYERQGGFRGDVDPEEVEAIKAKYDPMEADRKEYVKAKAAGRLEDYWATRQEQYKTITGQKFTSPPGVPPPATA